MWRYVLDYFYASKSLVVTPNVSSCNSVRGRSLSELPHEIHDDVGCNIFATLVIIVELMSVCKN